MFILMLAMLFVETLIFMSVTDLETHAKLILDYGIEFDKIYTHWITQRNTSIQYDKVATIIYLNNTKYSVSICL